MLMGYRGFRLVLSLAALAAAPSGALAQDRSPAPANGEITVVGRREALTTMLKHVLQESGSGQLARFETRLCPGVAGLPENYSSTIVGIIRANAQAAGLGVQKEGCRPNAIAVFVSDPKALIEGWKKKDPSLFGYMTPDEIASLTKIAYPVVSWRVTETRGRDGTPPERLDSVGVPGGGTSPTAQNAIVVRNASPMRLYENVREDILLSLAVVDSRLIGGKTLQQLGDLATLHLLLTIAPDAGSKAARDSILSLFAERTDGAAAPAGLSAADRGMLKGMYRAVENNFTANAQRGRLAGAVRREEDKPR
jgi:hypothetical protein